MSSKDNPDNSKDNSGKEMLSEDNPDTSSRTIPGQETSSRENTDTSSRTIPGQETSSWENTDTSSRTIPGQETSSRENPDKSSTSRDYSKATIPGDSSTHPGRMGRSSDYVISNFWWWQYSLSTFPSPPVEREGGAGYTV